MQKLSRIFFFLLLCTIYFKLQPTTVLAQAGCGNIGQMCCNNICSQGTCIANVCTANTLSPAVNTTNASVIPTSSGSDAFPGIKFPCDKTNTPEFNSLRPYQGAFCGDANKALYCSNELIFIESFDMAGKGDCTGRLNSPGEIEFTCNPGADGFIKPHNLLIQLDDSMFPIMGNTEEVKNSKNGGDTYDDATKVNEYASWYLSGVNNKAEYGENTDERVVNFSGPVQKLLPKMIQEAERKSTIEKGTIADTPWTDEETGQTYTTPQNHDQVVVCANKQFLNTFGKSIPEPCYNAKEFRLSEWGKDKKLSTLRSISNFGVALFEKVPDWAKGVVGNAIDDATSPAWDYRFPPLPWDDGTLQADGKTPNPFKSDIEYKKAYNEWEGKSCVIVLKMLVCVDNPGVTNTYADLYSYIPLSNTTDKKGSEYMLGDGPTYTPDAKTEIADAQHKEIRNAPLYFAHTQEVKELSELLNKTYTPTICTTDENGKGTCEPLKNEPVATTEKNFCSVANVRVNKGDNLFPGDPDEMQVNGVQYQITQATCKETYKEVPSMCCSGANTPSGRECEPCMKMKHELKCPASVTIKIRTNTKTPNAKEIFSTTVADSGSTFRKIFPKVGVGAPVTCVADIPTITDVSYTASNTLTQGESVFKVGRFPEDGTGDSPQLTFPHVGSVYEYFLKGIQTALRPKGYGEPIISGTNCQLATCGELPELPKASGSCSLGGISSRVGEIPQSLKDIVEAAAETYKTPPNLILGIMYGEGLFNGTSTGGGTEGTANNGLQWSDYNVKNWATCTPVPNCNDGAGDDGFMGFFEPTWKNIAKAIKPDLLKLDPARINEPSRCNLLDAVYGLAWDLHNNSSGGFGFQCFGYDMNKGIPSTCDWKPEQYISAIKVAENGYDQGCLTAENSCSTGGGNDALCTNGIDGCERKDNLYTNPSHMRCVYEVGTGK